MKLKMQKTMTDKIKTGIYIPDSNNNLCSLEAWKMQGNPTEAQSVVLITSTGALEIYKRDFVCSCTFLRAQRAVELAGDEFRCPTRYEAMMMHDALAQDLEEALLLVGGHRIATGMTWTCEKAPVCSNRMRGDMAFCFDWRFGTIAAKSCYATSFARPVRSYNTMP